MYFFSIFVASAGVIESLEKIKRRFVWGGDKNKNKISWVSWENVVAPKTSGGLGLGSLKALNFALIPKGWWKVRTDNRSLWCLVIRGIHNLKNKPADCISRKIIPGVWNNIAGATRLLYKNRINMKVVLVKQVERGDDSLFWWDKWITTEPLKDLFPDVYQLESRKRCKVEERVKIGCLTWKWKSYPSLPSHFSGR